VGRGVGVQTRDVTYVGSVAVPIGEALVRRLTSEDPVNLACGTRRTVLDLSAELGALWASPAGTDTTLRGSEPGPGDVRHSQVDRFQLAALLPDVAPIELRHGLEWAFAWFRTDLR
jgi:UDP-glucose 4-epimerase